MIYIVSGLPGSGKSTIGKLLAKKLNSEFHEMDDYLSEKHKDTMKAGKLITDKERNDHFRNIISELKKYMDKDLVVSGYLQKEKIRTLIQDECKKTTFIFLEVPEEVLRQRLKNRRGHFFKEETLNKVLQEFEPIRIKHIKVNNLKSKEEVIDFLYTKIQENRQMVR